VIGVTSFSTQRADALLTAHAGDKMRGFVQCCAQAYRPTISSVPHYAVRHIRVFPGGTLVHTMTFIATFAPPEGMRMFCKGATHGNFAAEVAMGGTSARHHTFSLDGTHSDDGRLSRHQVTAAAVTRSDRCPAPG
jgi:hypothetical protein